jgi:hypothetical protein
MTTPRLNTLTAGPMLRLMLAMDGIEPPQLPGQRSWRVFKSFLALPSASARDVASFQSAWLGEDPSAATLVIRFVRELTDDAAGFGGLRTRVVELQFLYELSARLPLAAREVWSDEFESLQAFTDAVETLPEWKFVVQEGPPTGELLEDEEPAGSVG